MPNTTTAERVHQNYFWTDKLEHRFHGARAEDATARRMNAQDAWNDYADAHSEQVFFMPSKHKYLPLAQVEIFQVSADHWTYRVSCELHNAGMASPFSWTTMLPTRRKATRAGIGDILAYCLRQARRTNEVADSTLAKKVIAACRATLSTPSTQATLV